MINFPSSITACLFLIFMHINTFCKAQNVLSIIYSPAITEVNSTNFDDFANNSFTKDLYLKKRPNSPLFGYTYGLNYSYKFNNGFSAGVGFLKSYKKSSSGIFHPYDNSESKVLYYHIYKSFEVPIRLQYSFHEKRFTPVFAFELGVDFFKKLEIPVYSINLETNKRSNSLNESHYGIKLSLAKFSNSILAGVRFKVQKHLSLSILPEFRYYYGAFRFTKCPPCSSFIEGNLWLFGLHTEINLIF